MNRYDSLVIFAGNISHNRLFFFWNIVSIIKNMINTVNIYLNLNLLDQHQEVRLGRSKLSNSHVWKYIRFDIKGMIHVNYQLCVWRGRYVMTGTADTLTDPFVILYTSSPYEAWLVQIYSLCFIQSWSAVNENHHLRAENVVCEIYATSGNKECLCSQVSHLAHVDLSVNQELSST